MSIEKTKKNDYYSNDLKFKELVTYRKYVVDDLFNQYFKIKKLILNLANHLDKEETCNRLCHKKQMLDESRSLSNIKNSPSVKSGEHDPY